MKFSILATAFLAQMACTSSSANEQLFALEETELEGKFDMDILKLNPTQRKIMEDWKAKIPEIFANKDYRMTWVQFWKAEEKQ